MADTPDSKGLDHEKTLPKSTYFDPKLLTRLVFNPRKARWDKNCVSGADSC
jgi:hypothetical protein